MARGWESKSVEDQQADAIASRDQTKRQLSPDEVRKQHKIQGLQLSRLHIQQQLTKATKPQHQEMLQRALADLEASLAKLG